MRNDVRRRQEREKGRRREEGGKGNRIQVQENKQRKETGASIRNDTIHYREREEEWRRA